MKISVLKDADSHRESLRELMTWADDVRISCAWATASEGNSPHWKLLAPQKISRAVIGVEFAQTEPWVLRILNVGGRLRVGRSPAGTFHPKLYIGLKGGNVRALVGSANLTIAAFSRNVELGVMLEGIAGDNPIAEILEAFEQHWASGMAVDADWLETYTNIWHDRPIAPALPAIKYDISSLRHLQMNWDAYYAYVMAQEKRLEILRIDGDRSYMWELDKAAEAFADNARLADIPLPSRMVLMGLPSASTGLIGNLSAAAGAKQYMRDTPEVIGRQLDRIPLNGLITIDLARSVVTELMSIKHVKLSVATRLLTVKRPDVFVSVNRGSNPQLAQILNCQELSSAEDYLRLLGELWELEWYRCKRPTDLHQARVWDRRMALLDSILYCPE